MRSKYSHKGDSSHPFFVNNLSFYYRVALHEGRSANTLIYNTPHEIILNLYIFDNQDRISYITRSNNHEAFTITVDRFKVMLAESIYGVTQQELELLYMRLILTNQYSKTIIDRGRFKQYDSYLNKFLLTIKGGYDGYLAYEQKRVVYYFKYRRLSAIHLLTTIIEWNLKNNIQSYHINIPVDIPHQDVIAQCLAIHIRKRGYKIYNYTPVEEDNIQPTNIDREIIQVINQLIL